MTTGPNGSTQADAERLLPGGGEMGALVRAHDWARTELGAIESWPQSLLTAVYVCLNSRFPMVVFWGRSLITLYNDAYGPSFGAKHPRVLGAPASTLWPDAWHLLGPMMQQVVDRGTATWSEDQFLLLDRNGFPEETYWTFSYSPIQGERGTVDGVFTAVTETTRRVLSERRLRTLRELGNEAHAARSERDMARVTADVLARNPSDVRFTMVFLGDQQRLCLSAASAQDAAYLAAPDDDAAGPQDDALAGALSRAFERREIESCELPSGTSEGRAEHRGGATPLRALAVPIASSATERVAGVLVVGVGAHVNLDQSYREFLGLVAGQLATGLSAARAFEEEKQRAQALAELDRAKTTFFDNVSHEFRTPLTLMLGPVEDGLSDLDAPLAPGQRERFELVRRSALRLLKLVNTLLDFSRIEAGRVQACYVPTDLAAFTAELASVFRSTIESAGMRLVVECAPLPEPVWVDRDMWEKIVLNLLSNAFKFTFEGEIAVALRASGDVAELTVRDTGTGIPSEALPHVFERFHRAKGATGRSYEGSGIGLALVHELVRLHGGSVLAESAEGRGSVFTVSLPFGNLHLPRERLEAVSTLASTLTGAAAYVEEAQGWLGQPPQPTETPLVAPPEGARPHAIPGARDTILIAEDNADMRGYLRRLLEGAHDVVAVESGTRALEEARARPPDLVLSDVMMPGLDGFSLMRVLKEDPVTAHVPVILLSARAGQEAKIGALDAGADDYLVKPFHARELVARVEATLKLARERAERERVLRERAEFEKQLVGIVSHDLRNPVSAIQLATAALLRADDLSDKVARSVLRIQGSAERASRLIRDLLDFTQSRLGGGIPIARRPANVHEIVRGVLDEIEATHAGRKLRARFGGDGRGEWDPDRLAQVVQNLVTNALKFSPEDSAVDVDAFGADGGVAIVVRNQGEPIPENQLGRIFEPMQRASADVYRAGGSLGLGLYIVKQIVAAHGGSIETTSTASEGTTFTVWLPREATSRNAAMPQPATAAPPA